MCFSSCLIFIECCFFPFYLYFLEHDPFVLTAKFSFRLISSFSREATVSAVIILDHRRFGFRLPLDESYFSLPPRRKFHWRPHASYPVHTGSFIHLGKVSSVTQTSNLLKGKKDGSCNSMRRPRHILGRTFTHPYIFLVLLIDL
jgi:hypothetical protein